MRQNFRTYDLAVNFYHLAEKLTLKAHLREQLARASASIVLNLAEGRAKRTTKDQLRFFDFAMGSLRECQAILTLARLQDTEACITLDTLGAHLYCLIKKAH